MINKDLENNTNMTNHETPELLAPAGSQESFHAAVQAGANAVYLGVDQLNARLRAKNFTLQTLSYLVPYAHRKGVKIHVTLNTLVKQAEMQSALQVVGQLSEIGIDAIIVQDIGFATLISRHYPRLEIHGSTQMAIHNSAGALAVQNLGLKRAILARELSLEEIRLIQENTSIDLELFVHGALCYCFSGICLASSYLGGFSGNRGRCTQVCRRRFSSGRQSGFYFSPRDFSALDYVRELTRMRIASFKIEGRMRSAEYVHTVVSAFRKILDDPGKIEEAREMLKYDFGREKTNLFLSGVQNSDLITTDSPSGTGLFLGTVYDCQAQSLSFKTDEKLEPGDRIRVHGREGFEGKAGRVQTVEIKNDFKTTVTLSESPSAGKGDLVYLVSRKLNKSSSWNRKKVPVHPARYSKHPKNVTGVMRIYEKNRFKTGQPKKETLGVRVDQHQMLYMLNKDDIDFLQFAGTLSDCRRLLQDNHLLNRWRSQLSIVVPPYVSEYDIPKWNQLLNQFSSAGISRGVASQFGQKNLFPHNWSVTADYTVWTTNRITQYVLGEVGYDGFCYSPEDDYVNIRATAHRAGTMLLFGYIPLFVSRIAPGIEPGNLLTDPKQESFITARKGELFYLLGKKPLGLTHRRKQLSQAGITSFLLDFSFIPPRKNQLKKIIQSCKSMECIPNTTLFNHKAGLK